MIFIFLIALLLIFLKQLNFYALSLIPARWCNHSMIYESIQDIYHPTLRDYQRLQAYLNKGKRPQLSLLKDYEDRVRHLRIIGKSENEQPLSGKIVVNCYDTDKKNCLIVYTSYNKSYPKGLKRLVNHVAASDFKGHILYRMGGWPNVEEGDLKLAHIPYSFKVCFFREARRLGYQRVLWLDASILPLVSLNQIFKEIEKKGYFTLKNGWAIAPFMSNPCAEALGITIQEASHIPSCSAGIFGVDFSNEQAARIIDLWYQKAHDPVAFFSPRAEQNVLSVILYQLGFHEMTSIQTMIEPHEPKAISTLFMIDRGFVHK